jgi:hypothetical protein
MVLQAPEPAEHRAAGGGHGVLLDLADALEHQPADPMVVHALDRGVDLTSNVS